MTTREAHGRGACTARVRATPAGRLEVVTSDPGACAYGPVEIAWYPDRLEITALGAGLASITQGSAIGNGGDVVVELRPPGVEELPETVPGAD